jgi:hypothetical protein
VIGRDGSKLEEDSEPQQHLRGRRGAGGWSSAQRRGKRGRRAGAAEQSGRAAGAGTCWRVNNVSPYPTKEYLCVFLYIWIWGNRLESFQSGEERLERDGRGPLGGRKEDYNQHKQGLKYKFNLPTSGFSPLTLFLPCSSSLRVIPILFLSFVFVPRHPRHSPSYASGVCY